MTGWKYVTLGCLAVLAAAAVCEREAHANQQVIQTPLPGASIPKYVDPLPAPVRIDSPLVRVEMEEFPQKVLPASIYPKSGPFAAGTIVWGYEVNGAPASYPGATLEQRRYIPTVADYVNNLTGPFDYVKKTCSNTKGGMGGGMGMGNMGGMCGGKWQQGAPILEKYLTIDQTIHWADPNMLMCMFRPVTCYNGSPDLCCKPYGYPSWPGYPVPYEALPDQGEPMPGVVHLHGGEDPSAFDGHPEAWFTPTGQRGPAYASLIPTLGNEAIYRYPNGQEATTLWYHDHVLGATRYTVFAGLAGFYLLRDNRDTGKPNNPIRLPAGSYEREILIQDRAFDTNGQFFFPDVGVNPTVHPFWIPEFFGDVIVVNGKSWPYMNVEARRYRLRFLNGANARFFDMKLSNGMTFWQIGTDGGFLDTPVPVQSLLIAPAERADVILDFTGLAPGTTITVTNDAPAPFPMGTIPDPASNGQVMQFRVVAATSNDTTCDPALPQTSSTACHLRAQPIVRLTGQDEKRQLTMVEIDSASGQPLEALLNNTKWIGLLESTLTSVTPVPVPDSKKVRDYWVTEMPQVGATEVWEIGNLTPDAHPIHLHLIQFQLVNRQDFNATAYLAAYQAITRPGDGSPFPYDTRNSDGAIGGNPAFSPFYLAPPVPPLPNENGWKDTIIMQPNQVTRIIARWAPQDVPVGGVRPGINLFPFDPTLTDPDKRDFAGNPGGPGYVWHCHILDHEDNEMMRPYIVGRKRQAPLP